MIQSAHNWSISDIFKPDGDIKYVIPKYQREYVWGKQEWEELFDDIWFNDRGHFLGSIICINQTKDALQISELELVDGQQRITTISLLYAAIYHWLNRNAYKQDEDVLNEIINLKYRLIQKTNKSVLKVEPSYQRKNYQDYRIILEEIGVLFDVESVPNVGNRRIYKTFKYFNERLNDVDDSGAALFTQEKVLELLSKLNVACLVKIEVSNHSDAFTLFESLNNRGIPLSALDLIKNKLLAVLEKQQINTIDENFKKWNKLLDNLSDDYNVQQRYLRQYYNSFKSISDVGVKSFSVATRSNLIHIYEALIDRNAGRIFADLYAKSKLYNRLINPLNESNPSNMTGGLQDLERIGGVASYSFILYVLAEHQMIAAEIEDVIKILVKYFVRRNLTDIPPTRDLDRIFIELIDKLRENTHDPLGTFLKQFLTHPTRFASDTLFEQKLSGNIYEDNVGVTRFILCKIEETHNKTKEVYTDLWKRNDSDQFIWTIEHIFPQGQNIPEMWVNMIAKGDIELANKYREEYVHKLGNLTISGYNSKLSNLSFFEKRDRQDKNQNYVGYKNGLFLNTHLANKECWIVEDIEARTKELVKLSKELFTI